MTTTTITPTTSINKTQLKDDLQEKLTEMGFTDKDVDSYFKRIAYRTKYNQRPEVKAARKLYNQERNLKMKMIASLLK